LLAGDGKIQRQKLLKLPKTQNAGIEIKKPLEFTPALGLGAVVPVQQAERRVLRGCARELELPERGQSIHQFYLEERA
jgi:hypothetical protein